MEPAAWMMIQIVEVEIVFKVHVMAVVALLIMIVRELHLIVIQQLASVWNAC
jgi:hypothetical protein